MKKKRQIRVIALLQIVQEEGEEKSMKLEERNCNIYDTKRRSEEGLEIKKKDGEKTGLKRKTGK
jgi:hypothetical protein